MRMHMALCLFFVFEKMMENGVGQLRMQDNLIRIGYGMAAHRKVQSPCEESRNVFMRASPCVARPSLLGALSICVPTASKNRAVLSKVSIRKCTTQLSLV